MSQSKFSVGEIVVLQSKTRPACNGEYEILEVIAPNGTAEIKGRVRGNGSGGYGYRLPPFSADDHGWWAEAALRKRQEPGEYSFEGLKQILSMPVDKRDFA